MVQSIQWLNCNCEIKLLKLKANYNGSAGMHELE